MQTTGRPQSTNYTFDPAKSPDERQDINDANYVQRLKNVISAMDAPPYPRPDPRSKIQVPMGQGMTNGEFAQSLDEQSWINANQKNMPNRNTYSLLGNTWEDIHNTNNPKAADQAAFLLDTFKRARSVGFPIHPFAPYFDSLPSTAFEGQAQ